MLAKGGSNSQYVIARAVFPKQSPIFGKEIASYLAMTFSYRELLKRWTFQEKTLK
jgi:hypothetical protein